MSKIGENRVESDPPPFETLTIVLASNRSGSTLLCQDIEHIGGLGVPTESFLNIIGHNAPQSPGPEHVLSALERGRDANRPSATAVKLMLSQAQAIARYLQPDIKTSGKTIPAAAATQIILDWAQGHFDKVCVIALIRPNSLDQAISKVVARATHRWHSSQINKKNDENAYDPTTDDFQMEVLVALPQFIKAKKTIRRLAKQNSDLTLLLSYDEVAHSPERTRKAIIDHSRNLGFAPLEDTAQRMLQKLIDDEQTRLIKRSFRKFLARHGLKADQL